MLDSVLALNVNSDSLLDALQSMTAEQATHLASYLLGKLKSDAGNLPCSCPGNCYNNAVWVLEHLALEAIDSGISGCKEAD